MKSGLFPHGRSRDGLRAHCAKYLGITENVRHCAGDFLAVDLGAERLPGTPVYSAMRAWFARGSMLMKMLLGLIVGLSVSAAADGTSPDTHTPPTVTITRYGIFCVYQTEAGGLAVIQYERYHPETYRLVPCPGLGDPGIMAVPGTPERLFVDNERPRP